jgi:large subunit ribosomal protein L23
MNPFKIIREPHLTEKASTQYHVENQAVFKVDPSANKVQIKEGIEKAFKVSVLKVRTVTVKGKNKRLGRSVGKRSDWKKAIVTLKEEDTIEYFEGA